jgi:hypothetical protein
MLQRTNFAGAVAYSAFHRQRASGPPSIGTFVLQGGPSGMPRGS